MPSQRRKNYVERRKKETKKERERERERERGEEKKRMVKCLQKIIPISVIYM